MPDDCDGSDEKKKPWWLRWLDAWLNVVVLAAMTAVTVYMALVFRPPETALTPDASVPQVLFSSGLIVWCFWAVAVNGAIYLLGSLVARTAARHWASQAGPITSDTESTTVQQQAVDQLDSWPERALQLQGEIGRLEEVIRTLQGDYERAVADLEKREEELRDLRETRSGEQPGRASNV